MLGISHRNRIGNTTVLESISILRTCKRQQKIHFTVKYSSVIKRVLDSEINFDLRIYGSSLHTRLHVRKAICKNPIF